MNKFDYKCRKCGSEQFEEKDSVQRITKSGKRNLRRHRCLNPDCGHLSTQPYRRDLCYRWVQYMAIKLRYKDLSYREIAEKLEVFIKQAGFSKILGRKKYSHEKIRVWIRELGATFLSLSKVEQEEVIYDDYARTFSSSAGTARKDNEFLRKEEETFLREYAENTGMLLSRVVLQYSPPFNTLAKDTWKINPIWFFQILKAVLEVAGDKLEA